jgi:hypothetical protein
LRVASAAPMHYEPVMNAAATTTTTSELSQENMP